MNRFHEISNRSKITDAYLQRLADLALTNDPKFIEELRHLLPVLNFDDLPILIIGERGAGKTELAKIIHKMSKVEGKPFVAVECGKIRDKIEDEMWGWKGGSFTGSEGSHKGSVELAEGGSLCFNDIDQAPLKLQNTIHSFVENKLYRPLGAE